MGLGRPSTPAATSHAIFRYGLRQLLAPAVRLSAGPGCPVCVTSAGELDAAIGLAGHPGVTLATFGDMLRVPGRRGTLAEAAAGGADVRVVYWRLDCARACRYDNVGIVARPPERTLAVMGYGSAGRRTG